LDEAGYLQLADMDSDALYVALADSQETRRAREVIAAHSDLFDDEDDFALMLGQATEVMAKHERVRGQLHEHEWADGDRSLPEAIDDVLAFTAEAERAYGLLSQHDRLPVGEDLPGAVQALISETLQVRTELHDPGYSCWTEPPAEALRELIATRRRRARWRSGSCASASAACGWGTLPAVPWPAPTPPPTRGPSTPARTAPPRGRSFL
jgi:hypothetical protein